MGHRMYREDPRTTVLFAMAEQYGKAGQGVIYWAEDGTALYKTPAGSIMHGKSEIKGNTNCTEWKERPGTACTRAP